MYYKQTCSGGRRNNYWGFLYYRSIYGLVFQVVSFLQVFPSKPANTSPLPNTCHMPLPSHSPCFDHPNNIWWVVQIMKRVQGNITWHESGCTAVQSHSCLSTTYHWRAWALWPFAVYVKLSQSTPWKRTVGEETQLRAFLALTLDWHEWWTSRPGCFIPGEVTSLSHGIRDWMRPKERSLVPLVPAVASLTIHDTDCTVSAAFTLLVRRGEKNQLTKLTLVVGLQAFRTAVDLLVVFLWVSPLKTNSRLWAYLC